MDIITYLLNIIQSQFKTIRFLISLLCRFLPLRQWAFDDLHSPKYQKFSTDKLPVIRQFHKLDWQFLLQYYQWKYHKTLTPVRRHNANDIDHGTCCPLCAAPHLFIYDNNGGNGQFQCKVCGQTFSSAKTVSSPLRLICPYCGHSLSPVKNRSFFRIHKCTNQKCSFYLNNLKKVQPQHLEQDYGKNKYKLHYLYREFTVDFFHIDLNSLPKNASSLKFSKYNSHIMSLCLTLHVNLQLSLRKTAQALDDLYGIKISHQQVANYARSAALVIKPFVDNFNYQRSDTFIADETYIKVRGVKAFVWFIMDAFSRSIIGYQVSDNRSVGPCILAMRMAFGYLKELPKHFKFIADGYSAYPLAAQQLLLHFGDKFRFDITQVLGLTNDDAVSKEFRPLKQMVERLNRTFKSTYRVSCGYDNYEGANYNVALWVAYYNFLRPHRSFGNKVLNKVDMLEGADNMPGKWQLLIYLGQQTILKLQDQNIDNSASTA